MKLQCDNSGCHKELGRNMAGTYNIYISHISGAVGKHFCSTACVLDWEKKKRGLVLASLNGHNLMEKAEHLF